MRRLIWNIVVLFTINALISPTVSTKKPKSSRRNGSKRQRPPPLTPPLPPWQHCFEFLIGVAQDSRRREFAILRDQNGDHADLLRSFLGINVFKWLPNGESSEALASSSGGPVTNYVLEVKSVQKWRVSSIKQRDFNPVEYRFRSFLYDTFRGSCAADGTLSELDAAVLNILLLFKLFLIENPATSTPNQSPSSPSSPKVLLGTQRPVPTWPEFEAWLGGAQVKMMRERYETAAQQLADFLDRRKTVEQRRRHEFDVYKVLFIEKSDNLRMDEIYSAMLVIQSQSKPGGDLADVDHPSLDIWNAMKDYFNQKGDPLKSFNSLSKFEVQCRMTEMLREARLQTNNGSTSGDANLPLYKFWTLFREYPILQRRPTPSLSVESSDTRYNDSTEDLDEVGAQHALERIREELKFDEGTWKKLEARFLRERDGKAVDVYTLFDQMRSVIFASRKMHDDEISFQIDVRFPTRARGAANYPHWIDNIEAMFWVLADNYRVPKTVIAKFTMIIYLLIYAQCDASHRSEVAAQVLLLKNVYFYYLKPRQRRADRQRQPGGLNFLEMAVNKYNPRELPPLHLKILRISDKRFDVSRIQQWNTVKVFEDKTIAKLSKVCKIESLSSNSYVVNADSTSYKQDIQSDADLKRFVARIDNVTSGPVHDDRDKIFNVTRFLLSIYVQQYRGQLLQTVMLEMPLGDTSEKEMKLFHKKLNKTYEKSALPKLAKKIIKLRRKYGKMAEPGEAAEYITDSESDENSDSSSNESAESNHESGGDSGGGSVQASPQKRARFAVTPRGSPIPSPKPKPAQKRAQSMTKKHVRIDVPPIDTNVQNNGSKGVRFGKSAESPQSDSSLSRIPIRRGNTVRDGKIISPGTTKKTSPPNNSGSSTNTNRSGRKTTTSRTTPKSSNASSNATSMSLHRSPMLKRSGSSQSIGGQHTAERAERRRAMSQGSDSSMTSGQSGRRRNSTTTAGVVASVRQLPQQTRNYLRKGTRSLRDARRRESTARGRSATPTKGGGSASSGNNNLAQGAV